MLQEEQSAIAVVTLMACGIRELTIGRACASTRSRGAGGTNAEVMINTLSIVSPFYTVSVV